MNGRLFVAVLAFAAVAVSAGFAADPPALNPFAKPDSSANADRDDAIPGYIEMSDGAIFFGRLYLTRDKRIKIYDAKAQRQREVPLRVIKELQCKVLKEWIEKEWRFKELALDEKVYTGRSYPSRETDYTMTLEDGRTITGSTSGIIFLIPGEYDPAKTGQSRTDTEPMRFLLHKRDKADFGKTLNDLKYVKTVKLGEEALKEGITKSAAKRK